jgi:hypothetical protein
MPTSTPQTVTSGSEQIGDLEELYPPAFIAQKPVQPKLGYNGKHLSYNLSAIHHALLVDESRYTAGTTKGNTGDGVSRWTRPTAFDS